MPFDETTITEVFPAVFRGGQVWLSWTTSAAPGTGFQVYLSGALAWWGTATHTAITAPDGRIRVDIGTVGPGEETTDFSSSLPAAPLDKALLQWLGGTYEDATGGDDIQGFRVYGESTPGGGINYSSPLADVTAYPNGLLTDGFGLGGFGQGGLGRSAGLYSWESSPLGNGLWHYSVRPYDRSGNEGSGVLGTAWVQGPPQPPARNAAGQRLTYTYNPTTQTITLNWLASPG
jgi:hypothetical protein